MADQETTTNQEQEPDEFEKAFQEFSERESNSQPFEQEAKEPKETEPVDQPPEEPKQEAAAPDVSALMEELQRAKTAAATAEHRYNSDIGRITAYQKKAEALEAELKKLKEARPVAEPRNADLEAKLKAIQEDLPEVADILKQYEENFQKRVDEKVNPLAENIAQTKAEIEAQAIADRQRAIEEYQRQQVAVLEAPREMGGYGFKEWRKTTESPEFNAWLLEQPEPIQVMKAQTNSAKEAAFILNMYELQNPKKSQAKELETKREKNIQRNLSVDGKVGGPSVVPPEGFEEAFEFFSRQREANERRQFR